MAAQLRLLDSDKLTPFVSQAFGNVVAGAASVAKLLFVNSFGDAACDSCEFGIEAVAGNDGSTYAEICAAAAMNCSAVTISGVVETNGGLINSGTVIAYKVTVLDRWGHESELNPVSLAPTFSTGNTNKITLSWNDVPGAYRYRVYSSLNSGSFYKVAEVATNGYVDLNATNDGATLAPTTGSVAYKVGAWGTAAVQVGTLAAGATSPVALRENVPPGSTSTGNPRQHKVYCAFLSA